MRKEVSFKNRDRFIQLGIAISSLRKVRGMSQEKLAEKANISRSLLSVIEAPNAAHSFSLEVLYDIADALDVTPADLINASLFSDNIINNKHD
ncbi:MAG TPA: helix-turn-helix transcriptional regulator [Ruminococcus sp.]|mgnify:FL=1|jgi:transcriptional regulator with XRE-family HTH domain